MQLVYGVAALAIALSGCASIDGYPKQAVDTSADLKELKSHYNATAVSAYVSATGEANRREKRDRIVFGRLLAYDAAFATFERDLASEGNLWGVSGTAAGTILNTGATLAKSARTKTRLSAYGLGLTAFQTDASKQLFYERTLPAILSQMKADRLQLRLPIEQGLTRSDAEYPLLQALVDLKAYEGAGSIAAAVSSISQAAENDTEVSREKIAEVRKSSYDCDTNCDRIRAWAYDPAAKAWDQTKTGKIQTELTALGITDPFIIVVTSNREPTFAGARAILIHKLTIP